MQPQPARAAALSATHAFECECSRCDNAQRDARIAQHGASAAEACDGKLQGRVQGRVQGKVQGEAELALHAGRCPTERCKGLVCLPAAAELEWEGGEEGGEEEAAEGEDGGAAAGAAPPPSVRCLGCGAEFAADDFLGVRLLSRTT